MDKLISVLKSNIELTPYRFCNDFLFDVANTYVEKPSQVIFKMFENGDRDIYNSNYRISPITIPLLLSLFEQLSKYHKKALDLELYNNSATIQVLEFLYRADFFNIGGNPNNFSYPLGRNIIDFEDGMSSISLPVDCFSLYILNKSISELDSTAETVIQSPLFGSEIALIFLN